MCDNLKIFRCKTLKSSASMSTTFKLICILLASVGIECYSTPANSSYDISGNLTKDIVAVDKDSPKDMQVFKNRQSNFAIGGPVVASLAFVGLNLAFISLLVPFVITAVTVGERRNYNEDESQDSLQNMWKKLRSLYGMDLREIDYLARSSAKENQETMDKISKFSQKFLKNLKSSNQKFTGSI